VPFSSEDEYVLGLQAEKNLAWEAAQQSNAAMQQMNALAASMGAAGAGPCKLSVSNLHPNIQVS
jgi:hypothetical protein